MDITVNSAGAPPIAFQLNITPHATITEADLHQTLGLVVGEPFDLDLNLAADVGPDFLPPSVEVNPTSRLQVVRSGLAAGHFKAAFSALTIGYGSIRIGASPACAAATGPAACTKPEYVFTMNVDVR